MRRERLHTVAAFVVLLCDHEDGIRAGANRVLRSPAATPEDRQFRSLAQAGERAAHDDALGAVGLSRPRCLRPVDLDDHRDPVALGNRLTESSATPFGQV